MAAGANPPSTRLSSPAVLEPDEPRCMKEKTSDSQLAAVTSAAVSPKPRWAAHASAALGLG